MVSLSSVSDKSRDGVSSGAGVDKRVSSVAHGGRGVSGAAGVAGAEAGAAARSASE